jgi:hypothetical protein
VLFYQCRPSSGSEVQPVQARLCLHFGIDKFHQCVYYYKNSVFYINQHLLRPRYTSDVDVHNRFLGSGSAAHLFASECVFTNTAPSLS